MKDNLLKKSNVQVALGSSVVGRNAKRGRGCGKEITRKQEEKQLPGRIRIKKKQNSSIIISWEMSLL